jgi:hypothetical protein
MPVSDKHPDYQAMEPEWVDVRACLGGERAVKHLCHLYLPMLDGMTSSEYRAYVTRALFYNASTRTVDGLLGLIFRRQPHVTVPAPLVPKLEYITSDGQSLYALAKRSVRENIAMGRCGLLVDMPPDGGDPYICLYEAEQIVNWRCTYALGREYLILVVLHECVEVPVDDGYAVKKTDRYRVLRLLDTELGPVYQQQVWELRETKPGRWEPQLISEAVPLVRGEPFGEIPFYFMSPTNNSSRVEPSPLRDITAVNLSHFRSSADLEHGRHFTALPTAWIADNTAARSSDDRPEYRIGSAVLWHLTEQGKAGYLEFTGSGLKYLETALEKKEQLMAILGARLLEDTKPVSEAVEAVRMRRTGEQSILSSITYTSSEALTRAVKFWVGWQGRPTEDVNVQLNDDFVFTRLTPEEIKALLEAYVRGVLPLDALLYNLKVGEILPPDMEVEDARRIVESEQPLAAATEVELGREPPPPTPVAGAG